MSRLAERSHSFGRVRGLRVTGELSVLVVEDEPLILDLMETSLSEGGYQVVSIDDAAAALVRIEAQAGKFQALVTDIRLGAGPDGWALAQRARELAPEICVVYVTGDSAHDWTSKGVPNSLVLTKPFAAAQLVTAVSMLMNAAHNS